MPGTVGLEVMNSIYPDVNWKITTKGRRTRKPVARNFNRVNKSPKRVGDFSGSDSDKFGEAVLGQRSSGKVEHVPIKKRRHMLQSPSQNPRATSMLSQDSSSPQTHSSSSISEDLEQLSDQNHFSGYRSLNSYSNHLFRGFDRSAMVKVSEGVEGTEGELYSSEDFSGIALLAAAACFNAMDDDAGNASKEDHVVEDSSIPECSFASTCPPELKVEVTCFETGNPLREDSVHVHSFRSTPVTDKTAASQSVPESVKDSVVQRSVSSKVDRLHWDLNTVMEVCDELYDDSDIGSISKNINDVCVLRGELEGECCGPQEDCDIKGRTSSNLKIEENNLEAFSRSGRTCIEKRGSPTHEQRSMEPVNSYDDDMGTSFEATRIVADKNRHAQVVSKHADNETSDLVVDKDEFPDNSSLTELCCSSSISELKKNRNKISGSVSNMQGEYYCSNTIGFDKPTSSEMLQVGKQNITSIELPVTEISASGNEDSGKIISSFESERPDIYISGSNSTEMDISHPSSTCENLPVTVTFINNDQCVVIADAKDQDDRTSVAGSKICDPEGRLKHEELAPKHEDDYVSNGGQGTSDLQDSCKNYSGGAQNVDLTALDAKIGLLDDRHNSDVSQDNHERMVDGDEVTKLQPGYESPYEDGELRGSVLYSWEENEVEHGENECVDYDSDGRNDIVSDAADCPVSEMVEGGSDASLGTKKRISLTKGFSETDLSNGGLVKRYLRPFMDSDNEKEVGGKLESNAGSGTTIEQSVDMVVGENDCSLRSRRMVGQTDAFDGKGADELGPRTSRRKLQSHIEGLSSFGATDGKDVFMQQYRSHHFGGSYSRSEKNGSLDKYQVRYKPASHVRESDGGESHWMYWGSRNHYSSRNHRLEDHGHSRPRSGINDSTKFVGLDSHVPRQSAFYSSKGLYRPPVKRSSVDRDDCFGVNHRMSLARGISDSRSRGNCGNYSPGVVRDIVEDFHEPVTGDAAASTVRMRRYFSRERSYSPNTGRGSHTSFTRRKSCSRSRSNSPQPWHLHRARNLSTRRYSRSPDFRSDTRTERKRLPFPKRRFASHGGESYMSPPKRYPSPQRRLVDDRNFGDNHLRHRRSPARMLGRNKKFDTADSSGRIKSDDSFRPMYRPGRFSLMPSADRESKFKESYEDRRLDNRCEMIRSQKRVSEVDGSIRRFPCDASSNFEKSNRYNVEDVRGTDRRNVPRSSREVKRSFNI